MNLWPRKPLSTVIKKFESFNAIDYLAPLEVTKGLSFANFLINEPNALSIMDQSSDIPANRSLIEQFGVSMKWDKKSTGLLKNCW